LRKSRYHGEEEYGSEMFVTENDYNTMVRFREDTRVRGNVYTYERGV